MSEAVVRLNALAMILLGWWLPHHGHHVVLAAAAGVAAVEPVVSPLMGSAFELLWISAVVDWLGSDVGILLVARPEWLIILSLDQMVKSHWTFSS